MAFHKEKFLLSLWITLTWRSRSGTCVISSELALPKSATYLKEGSTDWEWTGMKIIEMFYEMSKSYNEKFIIVIKYFFSFIGLRFNLKKTMQQKDSVSAFVCRQICWTALLTTLVSVFFAVSVLLKTDYYCTKHINNTQLHYCIYYEFYCKI